MKKLILFNGPPRSGKDTQGVNLRTFINKTITTDVDCYSFKDKLIDMTCTFFEYSRERWDWRYDDHKEEPDEALDGMSMREALIYMSETIIKPTKGKDFFGKAIDLEHQYCIFTDSGFTEELQPLIDEVGERNVLVIRLHRDGCDFSNDSRSYIKDSDFKDITTADVPVTTIEETWDYVRAIFRTWDSMRPVK